MSKASSKALTSSTVSSESAPRSSTKEAFGVTSPSSTPSCSTMICLTFSSTAAIRLRLLLVLKCFWLRLLLHGFGVFLNVGYRVLHGNNLFRVFVGDLHVEGLFHGHDQFHPVQGIGAQIVSERCAPTHLPLLNPQSAHYNPFYLS